jgi:hypothetical protein
LASTKPLTTSEAKTAWRQAGKPYFTYSIFLRQRFGTRVQRISVDAGFTCPNADGTVATGGCTFCDNRSFSPSRRAPRLRIHDQIERGIALVKRRYKNCRQFLAYFQPATNTYAPVERLRPLYEEALAHPAIVGLAIGTRPDCVPDDVLDLLEDLTKGNNREPTARRPDCLTYLSVEYGMQTMHDRSLDWMNRGHHHDAMVDAAERSRGRGFEIGAHVMLGLPDESHEDMLATARELGRLGIDAVKIHNLYCVRNTPLADQVARGDVLLMERDEYVRTLVDFIELLPPTMIVDRISGDAPPDYFIGPAWCLDKRAVREAVLAEFARRGTCQGQNYDSCATSLGS